MEARRLCTESAERRREERVLEMVGVLERCGKIIEECGMGCDIVVPGGVVVGERGGEVGGYQVVAW
jgi:hypothetical protein